MLSARLAFVDISVIGPERWLAAFEQIDIQDELREDIIKNNGAWLLGLM